MRDINFNLFSDASGGDPDATSFPLRRYHNLLWRMLLPSGELRDLQADRRGFNLFYRSPSEDFSRGSDAITHSFKNQKKKKWLTTRIPEGIQDLFDRGSTIGTYLVFLRRPVDRKQTINQAIGIRRRIDDRFDLTLECFRRCDINEPSPLAET